MLTRNSSPGKDGIPFKAWRKTVDIAAKALYEVFLEIVGDNGMEKVRNEWDTFNESVMVFLPKKTIGVNADGVEMFTAKNMRPLSISNTDNRIFCSAVRLHVEPRTSHTISRAQRGFVKGRSMLSNVIDVDEAMMEVALTEDNPAAFLFDFEAAFPSIDHSYILDVLTARG